MNYKNLLGKRLMNEKGFSVVEMMLAITIAGILVGAIGSFLMMHIKSFETTKSVVDIQLEGQIAINTFGKQAMEAEYIDGIIDEFDIDQKATNTVISNPKQIIFKKLDNSGNDEYFIIEFVPLDDKLIFKQTPNADYTGGIWYDFAYHVRDWSLSPGIGGDNYEDTDNAYITLNMSLGGAEVEISNLFKFRNKHN